MKIAAIENPRNRQEELGQFLTATPVADFMASMFGPHPCAPGSKPRVRWGLLVKAIIEVFCARWSPGAAILGIRDTKRKVVHLNSKALTALGVNLDSAAKLPDVIIHDQAKDRLFLIDAVIKGGPVDENRRKELHVLFAGSNAYLVFVTAFETRRTMQTFVSHIAWVSEVWIAEDPNHMIHFNGGLTPVRKR
jgi:adenine-specific DNA-methyltransferase